MLILGLGALAALAVGLAIGGRLGALAALRFRAPLLLVAALVTQAGIGLLAPGQRRLGTGLAYALVGAWLVRNARHHGGRLGAAFAVVAVGWMLNAAPVVLNGAMPVSLRGLQDVGAPPTVSVSEGHLYKHVLAGPDTALAGLGDVIPLRAVASVISVGDIVMLVGVMLVIAFGMARPERGVVGPAALDPAVRSDR